MLKRAAAQCAFATCDGENAITVVKMPLAIASKRAIGAAPQADSPLVILIVALRLPQAVTDIDHPPRRRLA